MRKWRAESVLDLYNILLALILFVAPWFLAHASRSAVFDLRLSSAAIIILSLAAILAFSIWEEWVNLVAGAWLFISPWVLKFSGDKTTLWNALIVGALVVILSIWDLNTQQTAAGRRA